jgi:hypothetical protein
MALEPIPHTVLSIVVKAVQTSGRHLLSSSKLAVLRQSTNNMYVELRYFFFRRMQNKNMADGAESLFKVVIDCDG